MFGKSYRIGRIGGVPINIDSSWIWIAVLLTYSLWFQFKGNYFGVSDGEAIGFALLASVLFFGSVLLHELAHAVAARLSRIEVLGITLVIFGGFTSAKADERGPGRAFLISAVGPAMSLALGVLFWRLSRVAGSANEALAGAFGYVG